MLFLSTLSYSTPVYLILSDTDGAVQKQIVLLANISVISGLCFGIKDAVEAEYDKKTSNGYNNSERI
jgi:hypothetical protein